MVQKLGPPGSGPDPVFHAGCGWWLKMGPRVSHRTTAGAERGGHLKKTYEAQGTGGDDLSTLVSVRKSGKKDARRRVGGGRGARENDRDAGQGRRVGTKNKRRRVTLKPKLWTATNVALFRGRGRPVQTGINDTGCARQEMVGSGFVKSRKSDAGKKTDQNVPTKCPKWPTQRTEW